MLDISSKAIGVSNFGQIELEEILQHGNVWLHKVSPVTLPWA
ncbi:hypothetical protein FOPG_08186 [Fusarium oxysporum f. sp. conglutinans race 2 54008]|uniref:NADP-dependent oxidoreductase domain-containing protein n=1 Tax=Fusarium oxysporum f. sp. conglutinans race 2 54008 TaxID=1089457 RepID=X0IWR5_FUSOX|nr:hypothetical protein FOPG_08186 [Fusarium oxysporum f. sp. conglutinans race 2 54008]